MFHPRTLLAAGLIALASAGAAAAQTATPAPAPEAAPAAAAAAAPADAAQKVVYHVNSGAGADGKAYNATLNNLRNHLQAVGAENLDLRVVMHGDGIELLQRAVDDLEMQAKIADLKAAGVRFLVCNNTLTARKIDAASLFEVAPEDIVPSGVAELAKLQGEGFAYIKP